MESWVKLTPMGEDVLYGRMEAQFGERFVSLICKHFAPDGADGEPEAGAGGPSGDAPASAAVDAAADVPVDATVAASAPAPVADFPAGSVASSEAAPEAVPAASSAAILASADPAGKELSYMEIQKQMHPNAYAPWTQQADNALLYLRQQGKSISELAAIFQRGPGSILSRLKKLES